MFSQNPPLVQRKTRKQNGIKHDRKEYIGGIFMLVRGLCCVGRLEEQSLVLLYIQGCFKP